MMLSINDAAWNFQVQPAHIATVAKGLDLTSEDYSLYGNSMAKVRPG